MEGVRPHQDHERQGPHRHQGQERQCGRPPPRGAPSSSPVVLAVVEGGHDAAARMGRPRRQQQLWFGLGSAALLNSWTLLHDDGLFVG